MVSYNPCVTARTPAPSPAVAGVIFDLGGTLIYPTSDELECAAHLEGWLRAHGWPEDVGQAVLESRRWLWESSRKTGRQYTMDTAIRRMAERCGRPAPDPAFIAEAERVFFEPELNGLRVYPDALRLLRRLQAARVRLACISNASSHWLIEQILARMGLARYFDPAISSAGFGRVKPDPAIFRAALARWAIAPGLTVMVGDTPSADVNGARAVGMRTIYAALEPNPYNTAHRQTGADAEARSLGEVERILFRWLGA